MKRKLLFKPLAALAGLVLVTAPAMSQTISQLTADGQTFDAYFTDFDGKEWLLIGRGREGWEFDTDGQGTPSEVGQNVGTTAAFAPKCYSDAIIIDLLDQQGDTSMANLEVRLARASDTAGTVEFQDVRWTAFTGNGDAFTWNIEDSQYGVTVEFKNAPAGLAGAAIGTHTGQNTRDANIDNDARRIFTWAWGGHNNEKGFSYGQSVTGPNDTTSFIWDHPNNGNNHAIPYTEVYIPYVSGPDEDPPVIVSTDPVDDSTGIYPGAALVATFDEKIALTATGTITVTDGSDTRVINLDGTADDGDASVLDKVLTITLDTNLTNFGATYDVLISADAVEDLATIPNAFAGTVSGDWNFTIAPADGTAPALALVDPFSPADEAIDVVPNTNLTVTFDEDILVNSSATQVLLDEDFESGNGGFAPSGTPNDWAWGQANSDNDADLILMGGNGSPTGKCWATVLGAGGTPSGTINAAANSILQSPTGVGNGIDLSGVVMPQLQFAAAIDAANGDTVEIVVRDVVDDSALVTLTPFTPEVTADWATYGPFDISDAVGKEVYLEFRFAGTNNIYIGLYIDDVLVTGVDADNVITLKDLTNTTDTIIPINDSSQVSVSGATLTINPAGTLAPMANYAIQIGSTAIRNYNDLNFGGIAGTTTWNFATVGPRTLTWDPAGGGPGSDGNGAWNGAGLWWDGSANAVWVSASPDSAIIGSGGTGGTIDLTGGVTVGDATFDNYTGRYSLSNDTLTVNGTLTWGPNNTPSGTTDGLEFKNTSSIAGDGTIVANGNYPYAKSTGQLNIRTSDVSAFTGTWNVMNGVLFTEGNFKPSATSNIILNGNAGAANGAVYSSRWGQTLSRNLGTADNQIQVIGNRSGFEGQGTSGLAVRLTDSAIGTQKVQWGSANFDPSVLILQSPNSNLNSNVNFDTEVDLNGADRTVELDVDHGNGIGNSSFNDGRGQMSRPITNVLADGNGGLIKEGPGNLWFAAANTYDGGLTVNEGGVRFDRAAALPSTGTHTFNTGIELQVNIGGGDDFTLAAGTAPGSLGGLLGGAGPGTSTVVYNGDHTVTLRGSGTVECDIPNVDAGGTTSLWLLDGNTTLSGNNTFSGAVGVGRRGGSGRTLTLGSATALAGEPSPVVIDTGGTSKMDMGGFDATIGQLQLGSNNGGQGGTVEGTGTLTITGGVLCDSHNDGGGRINCTALDLNGTTQLLKHTGNNRANSDLIIGAAIQNGGVTTNATNGQTEIYFNGANTYTGGTTHEAGRLVIDGSLADASMSITGGNVQGSGTLTFNISGGTVDQVVTSGGTIDISGMTCNVVGTPTVAEYILVDATGAGSYTGTFAASNLPAGYALDYTTTDIVKIVGTPGGSPFDTWASTGSMGPVTFDGDTNADSVADGLAFLLGAANPDDNALDLLPTPTEDGSGGLVMTFTMLDSASRGTAALSVEHSGDLGITDAWAAALVPDTTGTVSGVGFVVSGSGTLGVVATIPSSGNAIGGKLFGHLVAEE